MPVNFTPTLRKTKGTLNGNEILKNSNTPESREEGILEGEEKATTIQRAGREPRRGHRLAIGHGLWETTHMARIGFPALGDIVISRDHIGTYKVLSVSAEGLAELQPFQVSKQRVYGKVMTHIPISRLEPFKKSEHRALDHVH